jgi:uncharacterized membrane protein YfcA
MYLPLFGIFAGFIDSIAGGGGLITLPVLSWAIEAGPHAIGSNKIVGTVGALTALLVYLRNHAFPWKKSLGFMLGIVLGSYAGSLLSPLLNKKLFNWVLLCVSPFILMLVWKRDALVREIQSHPRGRRSDVWKFHGKIFLSGLLCGIYDGGFGPGGGTFMLLALIYANRLPLFQALVLSKLANTLSAGTSLLSYAAQGYVHWREGSLVAGGMLIGAFMGSSLASKRAERIVRPMLLIVVSIFMLRISYELFYRP